MINKIILVTLFFLVGCSSPTKVKKNIDLNTLIQLHNSARVKWGYDFLLESKDLNKYANKHAMYMLKNKKLKHSSMNDLANLGYSNVGENIAWNQQSEEEVLNEWLWSPGHRANILNKEFNSIGCGVAYDDKNIYWCVVFGKSE